MVKTNKKHKTTNTDRLLFQEVERPLLTVCRWFFFASITGAIAGTIAALFCLAVNWANDFRINNVLIVCLLPLAGLLIVGIAKISKDQSNINTVMDSLSGHKAISPLLAPVIMVSTFLSHLFGASVGREGAALQLGGSLGYALGKFFKFTTNDRKIIIMSGMSAAFSALFGTPIAAAIFPIAFTKVGHYRLAALLPCLTASMIANSISLTIGNHPERFTVSDSIFSNDLSFIVNIIPIAILAGFISVLFCKALVKFSSTAQQLIKNPFLRIFLGSFVILFLAAILRSTDYFGGGIAIIEQAFEEPAGAFSFLLKLLFTCISVAIGFKGGEIIPSFFIGATLGSTLSPILGLPVDLCAACGLIAVFCGVTNTPIASLIMSIELFGAEYLPYYALAIAVSFVISGYSSLYREQRFSDSKYDLSYIHQHRIHRHLSVRHRNKAKQT